MTDFLILAKPEDASPPSTAPSPKPPILATNAYRRTPDGWRLFLRHASPAVLSLDDAMAGPTAHPH